MQFVKSKNILIGLSVLIGICACCGFAGLIGGNHNSISATDQQAAATATIARPTQPPTSTPKPETPAQRSAKIAKAALDASIFHDQVKTETTTYDASQNLVIVLVTIQEPLNISFAQTTIKKLAYDVEGTFWQSSFHAAEVDVAFNGPVVDQYGNSSTGSYGYAHLGAETAAKFNWQNLTQDQAWDDYDDQALRQS